MKSTLGSLGKSDAIKGAVMFGGTLLILYLQQLIPAWTPWLNAHFGQAGTTMIQGVLGTLLVYFTKNLATDGTKEAVKTLDDQGVKMTTQIGPDTEVEVKPDNVKSLIQK
jgi:small neutral amino acid transporter SnatA (MarC family)